LGWQNVPIRDELENQLSLPVFVDNNVRAMALGEAYFGIGQGVGVLAFIYGRIGVGAGIVVNGQAYRGGGAGAGEIGHTIVLPHHGRQCRCGKYGCLETLVSEPVLLREAQLLADELPNSHLAAELADDELKPIDAVFRAAQEGDQETIEMIESQMHYLGIALANLVNILNPEMIILGGMFAQGSEWIFPTVETTMRSTAFAGLGQHVDLRPTSFGWRAGVIGAASLALKEFFYETEGESAVFA
jgi:glucokinase